jgi:hypothetical protein
VQPPPDAATRAATARGHARRALAVAVLAIATIAANLRATVGDGGRGGRRLGQGWGGGEPWR